MRFGAPLHDPFDSPETWIEVLKRHGYTAAYCPVGAEAPESEIEAYRKAAQEADILIAEVGVWNNPLDPAGRTEAMERCKKRLELADRIGALCAVNISGTLGNQWDGPDPRNFGEETFDLVVGTVREIIDDVRPRTAKYAIETMPWMIPYDVESSLRLVQAVDRQSFGIHYDPVNIVTSPKDYFQNADRIREFTNRVGHAIVAVHVKDIRLGGKLTVHLDEVVLGTGGLDVRALIREVQHLNPQLPMLLEHLSTPEEYEQAAASFRASAEMEGFTA